MCFRPTSINAGPVKCPKCGQEVDDAATLDACPHCGAKVASSSSGMPGVPKAPGAPKASSAPKPPGLQ